MALASSPGPFKLRSYLSYGLHIDSFIPIPYLSGSEHEPDVFVQKGSVRKLGFFADFPPEREVYRPEISLVVRANKSSFCFEWKGLACCLIENGSKVTVELDQASTEADFIPFITGPVSAVLLHQRGKLVLHSSVVRIHGKAVLFMANKGQGKSTLAAHLQQNGHYLVGDDLAPVDFVGTTPYTTPGHPQLRLNPDSVISLGLDPADYRTVTSYTEKREIPAPADFSREQIEIGCIFVLKGADKVGLSEVSRTVGFAEVARNTYLHQYLSATESVEQHFEQCKQLVGSVPVYYLERPRDLRAMNNIVDLVESTAAELFS